MIGTELLTTGLGEKGAPLRTSTRSSSNSVDVRIAPKAGSRPAARRGLADGFIMQIQSCFSDWHDVYGKLPALWAADLGWVEANTSGESPRQRPWPRPGWPHRHTPGPSSRSR